MDEELNEILVTFALDLLHKNTSEALEAVTQKLLAWKYDDNPPIPPVEFIQREVAELEPDSGYDSQVGARNSSRKRRRERHPCQWCGKHVQDGGSYHDDCLKVKKQLYGEK